jgi:diguanylate cyclase (GGDEF)-like protein
VPNRVPNAADCYRCSILIAAQDPAALALLFSLLSPEFDVVVCATMDEAITVLSNRSPDLALVDQDFANHCGVELLERVSRHSPQTMRLLLADRERLEAAIDAVNAGLAHRYLFKPWLTEQLLSTIRQATKAHLLERSHEDLLKELRRFNLELERKVHARTLELEQANRQLQQKNLMLTRMALTDPLTGLPNRRAMDRLAKSEVVRRTRYPSSMAIGLIDADHFHDVNATHLLSGGDHALTWLAQVFNGAVRTVDTVGRVGGEEFMVVAPETDREGAFALAERMRAAVASGSTSFNGKEIRLTVSIGVAVVPTGVACGYDELRLVAAGALNEAKLSGRNNSVLRIAADQSTVCQ